MTPTKPNKMVIKQKGYRDKVVRNPQLPTAPTSDPGVRKKLIGIGVNLLISLKDIFMNHFQDHIDFGRGGKLKTEMKFTRETELFDRDDIYCVERMEKDGTGLGMTPYTVENEFTRALTDEERKKSEGAGVWSIGEKLFWELCIQFFPKLAELGITVLTRMDKTEKWYYRNYNPDTCKYKFQTLLTTEEAREKGLPVDKIGSKGTYIKSYMCTEGMDDNWFESLCAILNLYFSIPFRLSPGRPNSGWWEAVMIKDDNVDFIPVETVELKGHVIPVEGSSVDSPKWAEGMFDYSNAPYELFHGIRISQNDPEYSLWEQKYTKDLIGFSRVADAVNITGTKNNKIGDNLIVQYIDRISGIVYEIKVIQSGRDRQNRGVMRVFVNKENLFVDVSKNVANLIGQKRHLKEERERSLLLKKWSQLYPIEVVKEQQLTDQLVDIFHGKQMPDSMHFMVYEKLCEDFQIPAYDYEWGKKYVMPKYNLGAGFKKELDIMIKHPDNGNHVVELKREEPDGDQDMNQIGFYAWGAEATRLTTVGVSTKGEVGVDINSGFKNETRTSFTSTMKNHPPFSHVDWVLIDLKYYDLHRVHKNFKQMPKR